MYWGNSTLSDYRDRTNYVLRPIFHSKHTTKDPYRIQSGRINYPSIEFTILQIN